jgi:hypothetical protein
MDLAERINASSLQTRMKRLFTEGFTAIDIAEPLVSFDADKIRQFMEVNNIEVVGVRKDGEVEGFVKQEDLTDGSCSDHMNCFDKDIILPETSYYPEAIECLSRYGYCFISILGSVGGIITYNWDSIVLIAKRLDKIMT